MTVKADQDISESLPCYESAECCGEDCFALENEKEPCWGETAVVDEIYAEDYSDHWWIHACEGHEDAYATFGGKYKEKHEVHS